MANIPSLESLITNLQSAADAGVILPSKSRLYQTLINVDSALKFIYKTDTSIVTPEFQGASYDHMLGDIRDNFLELSSSLIKMRSSFLPFELVEQILANGTTDIKVEQFLEADADKESFENVFFRLIGMPFSDELEDEIIRSASINGDVIDYDKAAIEARLNERQTPMEVRDDYPNLESFIFNNKTPLQYFEELYKNQENVIEDLNNISEKLKTFISLISLETQVQKDELVKIKDEIINILSQYPEQKVDDGTENPENITQNYISNIRDTFEQVISNIFESGENAQETNADLFNQSFSSIFENSLGIIIAPGDLPDISGGLFRQLVLEEDPNVSVDNLSNPKLFWKYCYLLFPPIQDGRISKCINDPTKLVAPPFLPDSQRVVNRNDLKSTLLEAIIRIRLDISSGTTRKAPGTSEFSPINIDNAANLKYRDISDTYGLLESLFIGRLFTALEGLALNLLRNTELLKFNQSTGSQKPDEKAGRGKNDGAQVPAAFSGEMSIESKKLQDQITFEESILLLLGQNSYPDVISLQEGPGLLRTSNIQDSHLMSTIIEIVSIPLKWAYQKETKNNYDNNKQNDGEMQNGITELSKIMGISKGIGALDTLVFIIALFSASELTLLSLLNENQFNNLKKQFPKKYFLDIDGKEIQRKTKAKAVEEISLIAIDTYNFFQFILAQPRALGFGVENNISSEEEAAILEEEAAEEQ